MYRVAFTHCCTAGILCDFPYDFQDEGMLAKAKTETLLEAKYAQADGDAVLVATLTTEQEKARAILLDIGFICSEPMKKKRHKDRDLYVLYLPLAQWAKANTKQVPRDAKGRFIKANPFK